MDAVHAAGCQKSTLAKLMSGLYQPWGGEIRYDGKLRSEIPRMVFTGSLAVVDQDVILFEDSITENIRIWDKSIEDFEIKAPGPDAQIRGLSGGNQQKVILAREVGNAGEMLVMDQPTRGLDLGAINNIHTSILEERRKGKGILLVSTELSEIFELCDRNNQRRGISGRTGRG